MKVSVSLTATNHIPKLSFLVQVRRRQVMTDCSMTAAKVRTDRIPGPGRRKTETWWLGDTVVNKE